MTIDLPSAAPTIESPLSTLLEEATEEQSLMKPVDPNQPLKITLISLHGLIRAEAPELGRDADTGGQIKYVLELARELAQHANVGEVELLTRQIIDPKVGDE